MEIKKKYEAQGLVYGLYYGGLEGIEESSFIEKDSMEELVLEVDKKMKECSLDFKLGFENTIGCIMRVVERTSFIIEGEVFSKESHSDFFMGRMLKEQVLKLKEAFDHELDVVH